MKSLRKGELSEGLTADGCIPIMEPGIHYCMAMEGIMGGQQARARSEEQKYQPESKSREVRQDGPRKG